MEQNFYSENRLKLLFMVNELHKRGYGNLKAIPSISPSGMHWRCHFIDKTTDTRFIASNWILKFEKPDRSDKIRLTLAKMADVFIEQNTEFIELCKGRNPEYEDWYLKMLQILEENELPYAFADWNIPKGFWHTSNGKMIKILSSEIDYDF